MGQFTGKSQSAWPIVNLKGVPENSDANQAHRRDEIKLIKAKLMSDAMKALNNQMPELERVTVKFKFVFLNRGTIPKFPRNDLIGLEVECVDLITGEIHGP